MLPILDQTLETLQGWLTQHELPPYRARQIWRWIFQKRASDFSQMTDLPERLRGELAEEFQIWSSRTLAHRRGEDGAEKLLLELADGQQIECVLLRDDRQHCTVCVSTQVGCGMGCVFCATGLDGLVRNLTRGEIIEQMLQLQRLLEGGERLSHIVVMGMGEPLANLDGLLPALAVATQPDGLGISARRITISTVGLPKAIRRLAREDCQYHLAVSLHAAEDGLRNQLAPANRTVGVASIVAAADEYFETTGRRVTFEYVLLAGVNDRPEHARGLVDRLAGRPVLVNVIPHNPVPGLPYASPTRDSTTRFVEILSHGGLNARVRYRKGATIDAACGQLRRQNR